MLEHIVKTIEEQKTELRQISDALWNHPETAYNEHFAAATVAEFLTKKGFSVIKPYCEIETAFRAEFSNGEGPVFAIVAEYDALPELGHGCGHNLICTAAIAAFLGVVQAMKDHDLKGKIVLLGTPAEEGGGGKVFMEERGCLNGIEGVIMVHPSSKNMPDTGSTANVGLEVIFHGKSAHAAAHPEKGINALDAVNLLFTGINTYRQYIPEHVRIHGVILDGGIVPNIIPDHARCRFYLRSADENWTPILEQRFRDMVKGAELMTGATAEINYFRPTYRSRKPNRVMNQLYIESMQALGVKTVPGKPGRGSSDFGNFAQIIPGIHPYFAIEEHAEPVGHSAEFAKAAGEDYGFENAMRAAASQAAVALRFIADETFRNAVKDAFKD
jgi:amidohydrolase